MKTFMLYIGAPELAFGVVMLLSLILGKALRPLADLCNGLMIIFMAGPLTAHAVGDDFTLGWDSNVGPGGIIPAAVITLLLIIRFSIPTPKSKKE